MNEIEKSKYHKRVRENINSIPIFERIEAVDVYDYLAYVKLKGERGRTEKEIYYNFIGLISDRAIRKQLERLIKWDLVKRKVIDYDRNKNQSIIFYESVEPIRYLMNK